MKDKIPEIAEEVYNMFWDATMAKAFPKIEFKNLPPFHKDAWCLIVEHMYGKFNTIVIEPIPQTMQTINIIDYKQHYFLAGELVEFTSLQLDFLRKIFKFKLDDKLYE
jgi:hypothetical protein